MQRQNTAHCVDDDAEDDAVKDVTDASPLN